LHEAPPTEEGEIPHKIHERRGLLVVLEKIGGRASIPRHQLEVVRATAHEPLFGFTTATDNRGSMRRYQRAGKIPCGTSPFRDDEA